MCCNGRVRFGALFLIAAVLVAGALALTGPAVPRAQPAPPAAAKLAPRGAVAVFNAQGRRAPLAVRVASGPATPTRVARAYLEGARPAAARDLVHERSDRLGAGHTVVRFREEHGGVPVIGGEAVVVVDDRARVVAASSEVLPDAPAGTTPVLGAARARRAALESVARESGRAGLVAQGGTLALFDPRLVSARGIGRPALVWDVEVRRTAPSPVARRVLVDARSGAVALELDAHQTVLERRVCDAASTATKVPCTTPVRVEGGPASAVADVNAAYDFAGDTYDFFAGLGRDGVDDQGMPIVSTVRYCPTPQTCPYRNAYWDGEQMVYGAGYAADDVVGHELTHGVTQYSSRLFYYAQSGAINESLSDIFGELIDLGNGAGTDTPQVRWEIGEDIPGGGALRDMADPTTFGDPDSTASPAYSADEAETDEGGVHTNSNVGNKAAYLLTDGDTFNGTTVGGIGTAKAAKVFYAASQILRSGSDFRDFADALDQACGTLATSGEVTTGDCDDVTAATTATAMREVPVNAPTSTAPVCAPGEVAVDSYAETFANGPSAGWARTSPTGANVFYWATEPNPFGFDADYSPAGDGNLWGDDPATLSDTAIAMTTSVTVPAQGAHLRMRHAYGFDDTPSRRYDGGVLEYSTNAGATWADAGPLMTEGGYPDTISSGAGVGNPLGSRPAFVRESNGYGVTRLDLSSLAGQQVRFRLRIGTGPSVGDYGWFVDDLRIYRCKVPDLTPPQTTVDSGPSGPVADATPSFTFSSSEPGSTFACRVDGAAFAACASPLTSPVLADGAHTFEVRATDDSGNTDPSPAIATFEVDTTGPDTALDPVPALGADATPAFTFAAAEPGVTFECRIDGAAFAACTSPWTADALADGEHTVAVRARDALGNADASPATATFTVDATAPQTTIAQAPTAVTTDATPAFGFTASEPGATFECRLDGEAFAACTTPLTAASLADGEHTFQARATDAAGNTDVTPASVTFTIDTTVPDTTPPDTALDGAPPAVVADSTPAFTFSASEVDATLECRVDGGPWAPCASPFTPAALADGAHVVEARASDEAGNPDPTPAAAAFVVDTTAPDTQIDVAPPAVGPVAAPSFAFSSGDPGATFECRLDAGAWAPCASPFAAPALGDGTHTFSVRATDAVGNADATPATSEFRIETPASPPPQPTAGGAPPAQPPALTPPGPAAPDPVAPGAASASAFSFTAALPRVARSPTGVRAAVRLRCSAPCRARLRVRIPTTLARSLRLRGPRTGGQTIVAASRWPLRFSASRAVTVLVPRALARRPVATVLTLTASAEARDGRRSAAVVARLRLTPRRR